MENTENTAGTVSTSEMKGAFMESLVRNNKQIKQDRAMNIAEDAYIHYKRMIEDIEMDIRKLKRDRDSMLDLSPTTATSLVLASDFKAKEFVEKDLKIGLEIRNLEIQHKILKDRFSFLFE